MSRLRRKRAVSRSRGIAVAGCLIGGASGEIESSDPLLCVFWGARARVAQETIDERSGGGEAIGGALPEGKT